MKFTLKVKAVSVIAIAALGALQAAHAQVDSTGITALRGTPRLEAAAPTPSQEDKQGAFCGLLRFTEYDNTQNYNVDSEITCNGTSFGFAGRYYSVGGRAGDRGPSAGCPSGYTFTVIGANTHTPITRSGHASTGTATCIKN